MSPGILGWDIGGVNTKAARLDSPGESARTICLPYEVQRDPAALAGLLRSAAQRLDASADDQHAITMTAELSQAFRTKREGIGFVLDALESVFPADQIHVYTVSGEFVSPRAARGRVWDVAASNWAATARWVAFLMSSGILIDIGTTTTDLIPVIDGEIAAEGTTDPERLMAGELVYTGALRTPVEAVASRVPLWQGTAGLSAEAFALMGDVYVWLGQLRPEHYTCPTPDGRPPTREYAGERLARAVCGDREMLDEPAIQRIALSLAQAQRDLIQQALHGVRSRRPQIETAVVAGLGEFIAADVARSAGLRVISLSAELGDAAVTAPAVAVASLLRSSLISP
jgi:(4-(4-[2-(gamma-L-glutamylamino)ethyl]phenoxymethyl)furan-2-yl)methanamine synthase